MLLCWAGMALAVLAKGLIGLVLPGAVLVLYAAVARLRHLEAPAPGQRPAAVLRHRHAVVRAGRPAQSRTAALLLRARALGALLPQDPPPRRRVVLLPRAAGAGHPAVAGRAASAGRPPRARPLPAQAAADLGVFIFFFFSYSSSKLPGYILPIFPALALLAAYLERARAAAASSPPACWW
jgi:4-amino-4-deoxy-L-arabinose transferase-like glycosyltransferase